MCGIFGFNKATEATWAMTPFLAWDMERRGRDSWGVTNGVDRVHKQVGTITSGIGQWLRSGEIEG